jgi:hypothetical protein
MNKAKLNYFIDLGLAITFLLAGITGIFKFPIFFKLGLINYKNFPMKAINFIHDWSGLLMVILVFIHIILHWKWIISMTKIIFKRKKS